MIVVFTSVLAIILVTSWLRVGPTDSSSLRTFRKRPLIRLVGLALFGTIIFAPIFETSAWYLLFLLWPYVFFLYILPYSVAQKIIHRLPQWLLFVVITIGCMIPEVGVALDAKRPIIEHLLSVAGFYIGIGATVHVGVWLRLSTLRMMLIGGIYGVIFEQNFSIIAMLFTNPIYFLLVAPTVFATYTFYFYWSSLLPNRLRVNKISTAIIFMLVCSIVPLCTWFLYQEIITQLGISAPVESI